MEQVTIKTSTGSILTVPLVSPESRAHFDDPSAFTGVILRQINEQRLYDFFFAGKSHLTFLDIGANVGLVSLYAQDACDRVVAVEPTPHHCHILRELTQGFPHIEVVAAALAPQDGLQELFFCPNNSTMNSLTIHYGQSALVEGLTLDSLCRKTQLSSVDLCKIDIESSEYLAVTAEQIALNRERIHAYFMECHPSPRGSTESERAWFEATLRAAGYQVKTMGFDTLFAHSL